MKTGREDVRKEASRQTSNTGIDVLVVSPPNLNPESNPNASKIYDEIYDFIIIL